MNNANESAYAYGNPEQGGGRMGEANLTAPQRRALIFLESVEWASPSRLGEAMSDRPRISAQGAGRIGGVMGALAPKEGETT